MNRILHMIYDDDTHLDLVPEDSFGNAKEQSCSHKAAESHRHLHVVLFGIICVVNGSSSLRAYCIAGMRMNNSEIFHLRDEAGRRPLKRETYFAPNMKRLEKWRQPIRLKKRSMHSTI
jgi:hypothetical protein